MIKKNPQFECFDFFYKNYKNYPSVSNFDKNKLHCFVSLVGENAHTFTFIVSLFVSVGRFKLYILVIEIHTTMRLLFICKTDL